MHIYLLNMYIYVKVLVCVLVYINETKKIKTADTTRVGNFSIFVWLTHRPRS